MGISYLSRIFFVSSSTTDNTAAATNINKEASRLYAELLCRRHVDDMCRPPVKSHLKSHSHVVCTSSTHCLHDISTPKIFPVKQQSCCSAKNQRRKTTISEQNPEIGHIQSYTQSCIVNLPWWRKCIPLKGNGKTAA